MCSTYICKWVYIWYKRCIHKIPLHFQKDERIQKMVIHKSVKVFKQWGACHEVPENYDCVKISRPRNFFLLFAPMILYDSNSYYYKYRNQQHTSNDTYTLTVQIYLKQVVTLWLHFIRLHCNKCMCILQQYSLMDFVLLFSLRPSFSFRLCFIWQDTKCNCIIMCSFI